MSCWCSSSTLWSSSAKHTEQEHNCGTHCAYLTHMLKYILNVVDIQSYQIRHNICTVCTNVEKTHTFILPRPCGSGQYFGLINFENKQISSHQTIEHFPWQMYQINFGKMFCLHKKGATWKTTTYRGLLKKSLIYFYLYRLDIHLKLKLI